MKTYVEVLPCDGLLCLKMSHRPHSGFLSARTDFFHLHMILQGPITGLQEAGFLLQHYLRSMIEGIGR